jgi:hypothetical protein
MKHRSYHAKKTANIASSSMPSCSILVKNLENFDAIEYSKLHNVSLLSASKILASKSSCSPESVHSAVCHHICNGGCKHGNQKFSDVEEKAIAAMADAQSLIGQPLHRLEVMDIVSTVHPELCSSNIQKWFHDFEQCWKVHLSETPAKSTTAERVAIASLPDAEHWAEEYPAFLKKYGLSEKCVVNVDET